MILLINIFKCLFFHFGSQYIMEGGKSLIKGYAGRGKDWLAIFFVLNILSAIVNAAEVDILCAATLYNIFPNGSGLDTSQLTTTIITTIWVMLLVSDYKLLDLLAKWVIATLTIATIIAVVTALFKHREYALDLEASTP